MIEQLVKIQGQPLNVNLHQEALVDVQAFLQNLQKKLDAMKSAPPEGGLQPPKQLDGRSSNVSTASSTKPSQQKAAGGKIWFSILSKKTIL